MKRRRVSSHHINPTCAEMAEAGNQEDVEEQARDSTPLLQGFHCSANPSCNRKSIKTNVRCRDLCSQSRLEKKISNSSQISTQQSETVGYCFDVAIGLANLLGISETSSEEQATKARAKLVERALAQSSNKEFRDLLAPEIRHAAALTVECMNFGVQGLDAGILPLKMCTEELQLLVNRFFSAPNDERVRDAVALCNDALGRCEGTRLHLDDLRFFFKNLVNRNAYSDSYKQFMEVWENVVEPADIAFDEYCSQESTYRQYIEHYYGKGGWFAFQREFTTERSTSMMDVTAKLLDLTLVIYDNTNEIYYRTGCYGHKEISIIYNGVDHFSMCTGLGPTTTPK